MMIHNNFVRKYFDTLGIFYLKNVTIKSFDANLMTSLKRVLYFGEIQKTFWWFSMLKMQEI